VRGELPTFRLYSLQEINRDGSEGGEQLGSLESPALASKKGGKNLYHWCFVGGSEHRGKPLEVQGRTNTRSLEAVASGLRGAGGASWGGDVGVGGGGVWGGEVGFKEGLCKRVTE